ncbi:ATP-dependent sacrificial sulfur transferase LarE [Pelotomaculum isophthalicicum JI]|uniref:ATP-dependent sacrificial sulfur transferase LarE n=1 Tax=Pelotomaculum isophthalicicum JI TaxID=947010 RepID=A0A9X4H307_9FIRM|nr:ATP-dependent sacrificial sulfur transferase LarE [Pelotomaculum isophthalicicum]MDF9407668.1 ATP-dependent sacrificial sulfur transferase LarE [Pelotomaculum isophthalicicum JI]
MKLVNKIDSINSLISSFGSVLVALSGGVDSSVLLKLAVDCLGPSRVLAATTHSETSTLEEIELAARIAGICGISHEIIPISDLSIPEFAANPANRCYYCQSSRFRMLRQTADAKGFKEVLDGSNQSDQGDYRPGQKALIELGIRSPLKECGFTKDEIRQLAKSFALPNWNRPANACLSSRFPYGTPITAEDLGRVAAGEKLLHSLGLTQCRLRHHGRIARIEAPPEEFSILLDPGQRGRLVAGIKDLGYAYVTLDLQGYRTGSLNEVIKI